MSEVRRTFHQELDHIKGDIVRLAAMVTECIPRGTDVLLSNDLQGAQSVIEDDDVLDSLSLEIEEHCYQVLALQQPVAIDLRSLVTAIRLVSEIERSGDLMVNVAKGARRIYGVQFDPRLRGLIERMSEEATRLFRLSIDAYVEGNASLAAGARRHGRQPGPAAQGLHPGHLRVAPRRGHRPAGRGAAGPHRPLLRAHRRPRREHRGPGRVHGHGLAARAQRRRPPGGAPGPGRAAPGRADRRPGPERRRAAEPALAEPTWWTWTRTRRAADGPTPEAS